MGVAFWPGGTVEDWGIISETSANQTTPLIPCTTDNNWNNTGLSSQAYLGAGWVTSMAGVMKFTTNSTCGFNGTDCSLQVYVGASGNDRNGIAFNSGWMIQEVNRFSVYSLYDNSKQDLTNAVSSNANAVIGETPSTTADGAAA
ncbi:hypothetical protein ABBQ32_001766 [Trebouxia sp. C0010 RCD-2024]